MHKLHPVYAIFFIIILIATSGCIQKSITDNMIEDAMQVFIDAPLEPPNSESQAEAKREVEGAPKNLTYGDYMIAEEQAAIEKFDVYRNKIKVQLVEGTEKSYWEQIGRKIVRAFAMACRDVHVFEVQYICELRIVTEDADGSFNALVGEIAFANNSERITPDLYNPSRSNK